MKIKPSDDIYRLARDYQNVELFGPNTKNPYLVLDLKMEFPNSVCDFLKTLPCPVIGIGQSESISAFDIVLADTSKLARLCDNIVAAPYAAMILVQHLRASEFQTVQQALTGESLAYGVLQNGPEFKNWLNHKPEMQVPDVAPSPLSVNITQTILRVIFTNPTTKNAISKDVRDALCEALDIGLLDNSLEKILLTGSGRVFSTGGDVAEFGTVSDPATAHWIRSLRQPANRLARLSDRLEVHVNGAAIGAGAEMAAFGHYVTASPNAWFQLPELKYGLIPGAGGTVSIPRRIGRHKTAYMALSMDRVSAKKALEWGLIDTINDAGPDI